jgi:ABC-type multidrug transport system fused ATPase/permease subunit
MVMVQADHSASMGVHADGPNDHSVEDAVVLNTLSYAYSGHRPIVSDLSLTLPKGSRCLLLGANGAGLTVWVPLLVLWKDFRALPILLERSSSRTGQPCQRAAL